MRRSWKITPCFFTAVFCVTHGLTAEPGVLPIRVADGLQCQQVADESLVHWPIVADWDSQGRLVVVESGGVGWPIQEHNRQLLHKVIRLVDENGDGVFDRRILAADNLPFTEGVLCLGNTLLVSAPPEILKLTDQDGDGFCEQREVWFDGQTLTNCANDLHGPYLGRDGWIYWCKGAFGEQTHDLLGGGRQTDRAAHIFRRRLEGGPIDIVISGGMDNPVELASTPYGERFFTSTFLQHPGDGKRDGIGHAVYGSVFGKDHNVLDGLIRTGPLMPIMTHLGPAAPSGLTCLDATHPVLAAAFADSLSEEGVLLSAQFNLHKLAAHSLVANDTGSFSTQDFDLLWTDQVDFHPTDVLADQDSLIVIDTGGWYDLCCPTSRVDQKVAAGGIYRVRAASTPQLPPKTLLGDQPTLEECMRALDDPRPWIQRSAHLQLQAFGDSAVAELGKRLHSQQVSPTQKLSALWALSFVGTESALQHVASLLPESNEALTTEQFQLCRVACQILAVHRYQAARPRVEAVLRSETPVHLQRVAAMALGRIGDARSVAALMDVLAQPRQGVVEHALLFALIELHAPKAVAPFLADDNPNLRRAAMLVLDQSSSELLEPQTVLTALVDEAQGNAALRQTALEILVDHPAWSPEVTEPLRQLLQAKDRNAVDRPDLLRLMRAWRDQPTMHALAAEQFAYLLDSAASEHAQRAERLAAWTEIWAGSEAPSPLIPLWSRWVEIEPGPAAQALSAVRLQGAECQPLVDAIHKQLTQSTELSEQVALAQALPPGQPLADAALIEAWRTARQFVKIARFALTPAQAEPLLDDLPTANALELPHLVTAIAGAQDPKLDRALLDRLKQLPVARTLDGNLLPNVMRNRDAETRQLTAQLNALLQATPDDVKQGVADALASLPAGDPVRGLQVFRSTQAACSACHQMGYIGGRIGPELTRIGKTRTREALLEAILFPNARIEQSYRPTQILTEDGVVHNGLTISQDTQTIELQVAADKTVRISRAEIEIEKPGTVSIMPSGMRELLSAQQLADLLALLESAQ